MSVVGGTLDTTTYKFGSGSLRLDGQNDYATVDLGPGTTPYTFRKLWRQANCTCLCGNFWCPSRGAALRPPQRVHI